MKEVSELVQRRVETVVERFQDYDVGFTSGVEDLTGLVRVRRTGLLEQDVLPGLDGLERPFQMQTIGERVVSVERKRR